MSYRTFSLNSLGIYLYFGAAVCLAQPELPRLGDRISGTVSLDQEYVMGQQFLSQLRRGAPTIPDALLNTYLESISYRLAARSQLTDRRLSFVIIDSEEINAFAAPGGIVGINLGLMLAARDVHEYASVMAHELAHLSQRHFARGVEERRASTLPTIASLIALAWETICDCRVARRCFFSCSLVGSGSSAAGVPGRAL